MEHLITSLIRTAVMLWFGFFFILILTALGYFDHVSTLVGGLTGLVLGVIGLRLGYAVSDRI